MSKTVNKKINDAVSFAMQSLHLDKCQAYHFGPWMIEPEWFKNALAHVNSGAWKPKGETADPDGDNPGLYQMVGSTAIIPISGPTMKARSKFGGTSSIDARNQIRRAVMDDAVSRIMLHIDSPGGTVAGTDALADDVRYAASVKPTRAHISDMGASAAYYVACQADYVTATKGSLVGSLGTRMVVVDSSVAAEKEGFKVHDVSTGEFKGAGLTGTPITDRQLQYFQDLVEAGCAHFKDAVMQGRDFSKDKTDALFDGKVHDAEHALTLGLIDAVVSFDDAMAALAKADMNQESFNAYAAEHPEATAGFIEQGRKAGYTDGKKDERDRSVAVIDAAGDNLTLAVEGIKVGHDPETVKLAATTAAKVKADADAAAVVAKADADAKEAAAKAVNDAHAAKIAELEAKMAAMPRGNEAASFSVENGKSGPATKEEKKLAANLGSEGLAKFAANIKLPTAATAVLPPAPKHAN